MTHTEHYGLNKPESNDFYDVSIGNDNLDTIDELIKENEDAIENIAGEGRTTETVVGAYAAVQQAAGQVGNVDSKIGSTGDTGGSATVGSVFAKLNALLQKFVSVWTDGRAAKLDNLDGTVSSRAPSNTALSTAQWTNTRAGYLDAAISGRAPASTALSTAQWTNARAGYLDRLDAAISTRASQGSVNEINAVVAGASNPYVFNGVLASFVCNNQDRIGWVDVANISGKGRFFLLTTPTYMNQLEVIIDGVRLCSGNYDNSNPAAVLLMNLATFISSCSGPGLAFSQSLLFRIYLNQTATLTYRGAVFSVK